MTEHQPREQASPPAAPALAFGEFTLDPANYLLHGPRGATQRLQPKTFDLLHYLLRNPGRVLDKDELLAAVWPGVVVTEHSLTRCIKDIRKALGDDAQSPRYIQTLARRGYRVGVAVTPVAAAAVAGLQDAVRQGETLELEPAGLAATTKRQAAARWVWVASLGALVLVVLLAAAWLSRDRETAAETASAGIAVLPFAHDTADEPARVLAEGLAEDLIDLLAQVPGLQVAARNSSFVFGAAADARQLGRELGVQWVVQGRLRQVEQRLRLSVQLVDARSGYQTWSAELEQGRTQLFVLHDELARSVVEQVAQRLVPDLRQPASLGRSRSPQAHEAFVLGRDLLNRRPLQWRERALAAFERAVAIDDTFARAHAGLAMALALNTAPGQPSIALERAAAMARRARQLDERLGMAHAAEGLVLLVQGQRDEAEAPLRRALALDPLFSPAYNWLSVLLMELDREAESLQVLQAGLRVDRLNPALIETLGVHHVRAGQLDAARLAWERALSLPVRPMGVVVRLRDLALEQGRLLDALRHSHTIDVDAAPRWGVLSAVHTAAVLVRLGLDEPARQRLAPLLSHTEPLPAGTLIDLEDALRRQGGLARLLPLLDRVAAAEHAPPWLREQRVRSLLLTGQLQTGLALALPDEPRRTGRSGGLPAVDTLLLRAWALQQTGSRDQATRILDAVALGFDRGHFGAGPSQAVMLGTLRLLSGQREQALAELERAAAAGWCDDRGLAADPRWRPLLAEPRVRAVLAQAQHRVQAQRQALASALASSTAGDLPPLPAPHRP